MERLADTMRALRDRAKDPGVHITLENMPWFYIKKAQDGGTDVKWESTLLVDPVDAGPLLGIVDGLTLDVSHGYLHSPTGDMDAIEGFVQRYGERITHLHLSDALPPDHEGLQIGEGNVDFRWILASFKGREVSAIPEILGGHMGGGLGFRRALEELRAIETGL
jgi:sugar phosphate isomerase/epimerase